MRPIRASEIGSYLYCRRAWWYRLRGVQSANQAEMAAGTALHEQHGRKVFMASILRNIAIVLALAALALLTAYCTTQLTGLL
jgi:CRISPR/Cas system-associated exonuclease Cas4 (RecB family)